MGKKIFIYFLLFLTNTIFASESCDGTIYDIRLYNYSGHEITVTSRGGVNKDFCSSDLEKITKIKNNGAASFRTQADSHAIIFSTTFYLDFFIDNLTVGILEDDYKIGSFNANGVQIWKHYKKVDSPVTLNFFYEPNGSITTSRYNPGFNDKRFIGSVR